MHIYILVLETCYDFLVFLDAAVNAVVMAANQTDILHALPTSMFYSSFIFLYNAQYQLLKPITFHLLLPVAGTKKKVKKY